MFEGTSEFLEMLNAIHSQILLIYFSLVCVCVCVGHGLEDLMTVNLARYKPTGERVTIRRIDMESCTNDMVKYLQVCSATVYVSLLRKE